VVITLTERSPVAALPDADGTFRLIDPAGVVFRTVPARPAGLALLVLANPGPQDQGTRAGLSVLAALTGELRGALVRLVVTAPTRISLELVGDRTVLWGDATDNDAKATVATALLKRAGKTIDVSAPSVVTVN
jgi:cell division protein FtsQ